MKNFVIMLVIASQLVSCNSKESQQKGNDLSKDAEKTTTKTDTLVEGNIYEGVLPCADCSGIETVLKIYEGDGTQESHKFELLSTYKGKQPVKTFTEKGNYNTERGLEKDTDGTIYVLNWDKPESEQIYYGYKSGNPEKIYLLNNKKQIIKSKLNYFLTLKK